MWICRTTSIGEKQETKKLVCRILHVLRRTQNEFEKDSDHSSDQELKKSDTESTTTNQMVCGIMLLV